MKIRICLLTYTTKNTVISPNFLVWKLGDITAFFAVLKVILKTYPIDFERIYSTGYD